MADRPLIMGILNVTPDSFSDGGFHVGDDAAVAHGRALVAAGADIVDVGGASSRPGADPVPVEVEIERTSRVVARLVDDGIVVSIDTEQPAVAAAAVEEGAHIVNDISGLGSEEMLDVVRDAGTGAVVMHMQGRPGSMQDAPTYDDVVEDVAGFLTDRAGRAVGAGIDRQAIVVDPGIGFGKTAEHNLALLGALDRFRDVGPVLVGTSRKRFLGTITGREAVARDGATAATTVVAVMAGAAAVRVHDVERNLESARVAWAIVSGSAAAWAPVSME